MAQTSTTPNHNKTTFKICLIGDGGVGKTTFIKRHRTGEFEKKYVATLGVEVHPLRFMVEGDKVGSMEVCFNVWDTAGQEKFGGLREGYYLASDAAIVMFDRSSLVTWNHVLQWVQLYHKTQQSPVVLVGNKVDVPNGKVDSKLISSSLAGLEILKYFDISAKSNYQFDKPFLALARELLHDESIRFVENPAIKGDEITMSRDHIALLQQEAEEASKYPRPIWLTFNEELEIVAAWRGMKKEDIFKFIADNNDLHAFLLQSI